VQLVGEPVGRGDLVRRLGPLADELHALGLLAFADDVAVPAARLVPCDDLLIASDAPGSGAAGVAPAGPAAFQLAALTIRRQVRRALDIGTGNGLQAILASRHADRVVATDPDPRALAFAAFNCALNGIGNVEFRRGEMPVADDGERFGLVVANRVRLLDADHAPPDVVVRGVPTLLELGGYGTVQLAWDATEGGIADRPAGWLAAAEVDAWVLHTGAQEPVDAAVGLGAADGPAAVERWLAEYRRLGIGFVAAGAVVMRLRPGGGHVRSAGLPGGIRHDAGTHLERMFEAPDEPLRAAARVTLVPGVELVGCERPGAGGWTAASYELRLRDGLRFAAELNPEAVAIVRALDGRATVAELGLGAAERRFVQRLVELGFAEAA
jgi:SAM-dependent methyltransferase